MTPFLRHITFTGIDEDTNLLNLLSIVKDFTTHSGQVEIGVLYSEDRAGKEPGYPGYDFISNFGYVFGGHNTHIQTSLHICGAAARKLIQGETSSDTSYLLDVFPTYQINYTVKPLDCLATLVDRIKTLSKTHLVIIQNNSANATLCELLDAQPELDNVEILFDSSGGNGLCAGTWPTAMTSRDCGYAGGLGPHNIDGELAYIEEARRDKETFIDMQSLVRTDDKFDLAKVERVLVKARPYLLPNPKTSRKIKYWKRHPVMLGEN